MLKKSDKPMASIALFEGKKGSGSCEKDRPVKLVAMEKEQKTRLVHEC